jgi:hypothetical protein
MVTRRVVNLKGHSKCNHALQPANSKCLRANVFALKGLPILKLEKQTNLHTKWKSCGYVIELYRPTQRLWCSGRLAVEVTPVAVMPWQLCLGSLVVAG